MQRKSSSSTASIGSSLSSVRRDSDMSISSSDDLESKEKNRDIFARLDSCLRILTTPSKSTTSFAIKQASFNDEINKAYLEIKALTSNDEKEELFKRMLEIIQSIETVGRQNDKLLGKLFETMAQIKLPSHSVDELSSATIPANLATFIEKFLKDRLTELQLSKDLQSQDNKLALKQFIDLEPEVQNRTIAQLKKLDPERAKPFELFVKYFDVTVRATDPQTKIDAIPDIKAGLASLKKDGADCFEQLYSLQFKQDPNRSVQGIIKNLEALRTNQMNRDQMSNVSTVARRSR